MQRILPLVFLLITSQIAWGQAVLSGKILDKKTGEGAIGATVIVTGTTQAAPVDVDGTYRLTAEPGTYTISVQSIGYKALTFPGVVLREGQTTTINGSLEEDAQNLKEVVVTGQKQTGTEVAMIQDLKKSEVVVSGMSSDQIVKTLDRDAAEVVKRIPGVTVQSNNFIVIRGLAERYNTVLLNDALTPSAEVDTRSFSFDILPSSVIDRVLIFKGGSPELPGEFGGGIVKVYTKNSVLENSTSLSVSGWARSTNTFQGGYLQSNRSSTDWLGTDGGLRGLPSGLNELVTAQPSSPEQTAQLRNQLTNNFVPRQITSRPDMRVSLGLTRKFDIGRVNLSNVTSISYSNTQEQNESVRQRYTSFNTATPEVLPGKVFDYVDTRSLSAVRLGVIHNYQARLSDNHRLELRNFLNQYGTDEIINRRGVLSDPPLERNNLALHYQSRTIYSGQLGGVHNFGARKADAFTWALGYNYVYRDEPDYRLNIQERDFDPDRPGDANPAPYRVAVNRDPTTSSRFFSTLKENTYMTSGQYEHSFLRARDTTSANQYKLRVGYYLEEKERNYDSRYFNYDRSRNFDLALLEQPLSTIFSPGNIRADGGFVLREATLPQDRYTGNNRLLAGYVSGVAPISDKLNLTGGVRVEYNRRRLAPGAGDKYEEIRTFALPSLNATYNFNLRSVLRAGVSQSVNRPEFREIANYTYYDVSNNFFIQGNRNLRTANIYNADLRYEFYPTRSEMLSVGIFGKRFFDAIEQVTRSSTSSDLLLTYQNADRAYDVGAEVEVRKSLLDMSQNRFLQRVSFAFNATVIRSRVQIDTTLADNRNFAINNRPLQGQSPYVINLSTFYQDDEHGWKASVQYNVVGPRIAFVGDQFQNYSIFDLPRHLVDLSLTKGIGTHLEVRAGIQNLLDQKVRQYYDFDRNGRINGVEKGAAFAEYRRGSYSTLGLTYRF